MLSPSEYDLHVRPDTRNIKQRIWFYFTVKNTAPGQRVIFNIVNLSKAKSLFREGTLKALQGRVLRVYEKRSYV